MKIKKIIYKIIPILIVLSIFYFLSKILINNWQKVKEYEFSFNYFYLFLSLFFLNLSMILGGCVWKKILQFLGLKNKFSYFDAIKIYIYSLFGKYIPGKVWTFVVKAYLGSKKGLSRKILTISIISEVILSITSGFLLSLLLLGIIFGSKLYNFYIIPILIIVISLIFIHPKIICPLFNFGLRKFKKIKFLSGDFLNYKEVIQIIFYYFIILLFEGIGFFFFINSIASLPFYDIMGVVGGYVAATLLGVLAFFAPAGLGVKESLLVLILQFYFPISIAILLSLLVRIWSGLGEVILFISIYTYSKFHEKDRKCFKFN